MTLTLGLFTLVIVLAFIFGLTNGFIDGGGLVSTVITTRALEPFWALMLVAAGGITGVFLLGRAGGHMFFRHLVVFPPSAPPRPLFAGPGGALFGWLCWGPGVW